MARFRRIRNEEDEAQNNPLTFKKVNQHMQNSAHAGMRGGAGGLGDIVMEAVMSGIAVIISMVALVVVLWAATGFQTR
ncbi:hypothetical protein BBC27_08790 [Acidithiobacillus ferrivorans]|uniref:Uncharacterized protein n=1 Tax=Acidithiobacillus ferrivorans TaxID=160808 RepID=A0A1B9C041_9PROT|nr:hypothetical protein [Acidithiobacillus ferrivorans]OCB03280.1 hypothetical protein BBC27_08790 [Acidithiobacillus ferrivorans]